MSESELAKLIHLATNDGRLRYQLYHCPDKVISNVRLTEEEARAIRHGDLSSVNLDEDTLRAGRRIFNEIPLSGDMPPEHAAVEVFALRPPDDPCL